MGRSSSRRKNTCQGPEAENHGSVWLDKVSGAVSMGPGGPGVDFSGVVRELEF